MTLDSRPSDADLIALAAKRTKKSSRLSSRIAQYTPTTTTVRITIPLKWCVSDNRKYYAVASKGKARLFLSPEYRDGKEKIRYYARQAMGSNPPFRDKCSWSAVVHFENNRRDLLNACKILQDGMNGIVFDDDKQIKDSRWVWGVTDKDTPRVEITVSVLEAK